MRAWIIKLLGGIPKGLNVFVAQEDITHHQRLAIIDYLSGKRFMSRYHAGQKKEKVKKERKSFVKAGMFI